MDRLSIFGLTAVTLMLICYALEDLSRWFILAFAGACLLASAYGFLQGAWATSHARQHSHQHRALDYWRMRWALRRWRLSGHLNRVAAR